MLLIIVFLFAFQEGLFRIAFPLPDVTNFNRIDYSKLYSSQFERVCIGITGLIMLYGRGAARLRASSFGVLTPRRGVGRNVGSWRVVRGSVLSSFLDREPAAARHRETTGTVPI